MTSIILAAILSAGPYADCHITVTSGTKGSAPGHTISLIIQLRDTAGGTLLDTREVKAAATSTNAELQLLASAACLDYRKQKENEAAADARIATQANGGVVGWTGTVVAK